MNIITEAVFPIVTYKAAEMGFASHGSAFFINGEGVFITAAHTVKQPTRDFYGWVGKKLLPFSVLFMEYEDFEDQQPPIYKDLLIGKILDISTPNYYSLTIVDKLYDSCVLTACGYSLTDQSVVIDSEPISIEDIFENITDDEFYETFPPDNKLNRLAVNNIPVVFKHREFFHIDNTSSLTARFENGFTFQSDLSNLHGHSGCPIIDDNKVYGMLIGAKAAIDANYILDKLAISHSTETAYQNLQLAGIATPENAWLTNAVRAVHEILLQKDPQYIKFFSSVVFISSADVHQLENPVSPYVTTGIGGVQSNYFLNGVRVHLVIINPDACERANFSSTEIQAAIVHELGHIFNMNTHAPRPSIRDFYLKGTPYNLNDDQQIHKTNLTNDEIYADYYAREHGWSNPLRRGLIKYRNSPEAVNIDMIDLRLDKFETDEKFCGTLKLLRDSD